MAAIPPRVDPADVLIGRDGLSLNDLPAGSVIGTGSPRRAVQLRAARPDIEVRGVRGNVDTRIAHVRDGRLDAVVLAAAGVRRIGRLAEATDSLNFDVMLPAPGQGALAVETRSADSAFATTVDILDGDAEVRAALRRIHDQTTDLAVTCERAILSRAEAGCSAPIGALAKIEGTEFIVDAVMADDDGKLARTRQSAELPALVDVDWSTGNEQQLTVTAKELARVADELGTAAAEDLLGRLGIDPAPAPITSPQSGSGAGMNSQPTTGQVRRADSAGGATRRLHRRGPGESGLMTMRGAEILATAETVVYDADVHSRSSPPMCRRPRRSSTPPTSESPPRPAAVAGRTRRPDNTVVRLSSDDGIIFTTTTAEAAVCRKGQVEVEIVPGVGLPPRRRPLPEPR